MKLEMTDLGPIKRALKIEVSQEDVNREFTSAYAELNRQVRIPGFRPGKAPLALLEKRYAKAVEEDVVRKLIPTYYDRAVRQAGIVPILVEVPPIERMKIKRDAPFTFTATVEIKPKIELRDYKPPNPISLKPDKRTVGDEEINRALNLLREQQAQLQAAPAGTPLAEGDYAVLDIEGFLDLAPLEGSKKDNHLHQVGSKVPVMGVEVDEHLVGKKAGEFVEVSQPYPATHPDSHLAGKSVVFRLRVTGVKRKELPPLDDEFAKDCGPYNSLEELKDKLRSGLEAAMKREIEESYKDTIQKRLEATHHFDVPDTLVERELVAMVRHHFEQVIRQKGRISGLEDPVKRQEEIRRVREELRPEATRRVKVGLILETIAEREGITVEAPDVEAELQRLSTEAKVPLQEVQRMIAAGGEDAVEELRGRILADKTVDFVYRHAVIQG
ncbi:MAG: trigger factor [Nitrospirales bacterium]